MITASIKKIPTPRPTVTINKVVLLFITSFTCCASTDKSGSATVIKTPITKQTSNASQIFLVLISDDPICSPIGLIAISAPKLNKPIPTIKKTALIIKITNSRDVRLNKGVKYNSITNIVTGRTDISDSLIFFLNSPSISSSLYFNFCAAIICRSEIFYPNFAFY